MSGYTYTHTTRLSWIRLHRQGGEYEKRKAIWIQSGMIVSMEPKDDGVCLETPTKKYHIAESIEEITKLIESDGSK